jgi:hypothetical protein
VLVLLVLRLSGCCSAVSVPVTPRERELDLAVCFERLSQFVAYHINSYHARIKRLALAYPTVQYFRLIP